MTAQAPALSEPGANLPLQHTWPLALLAVGLPTAWPFHQSPSITFYNQLLAVLGWGLWTLALAWTGRKAVPQKAPQHSVGMTAASITLWLVAGSALGSAWSGGLPWGLALMASGLALSAWWVLQSAWHAAHRWPVASVMDVLALALAGAGVLGVALGIVQIFIPSLADGDFIARSVTAGRAVGNLRQPNHLSTLLVMAICGSVWLGRRGRWPVWLSVVLALACMGGVVGTASRTGMVAMGLLLLWGWRDRGLPAPLRGVLLAAPLWWGMAQWAEAGSGHAFAAQARLHDGSDISSSRFKIWANTLDLILAHPWTGVGWGQFNLAWTLTEFPTRPIAFFDHTHNIVLQWAVELGIPMALLLIVLCATGLWPLLNAMTDTSPPDDRQGVRLAAATIVGVLALHSLLEYPLWYAYFLLPGAFVWGLGLAAAESTQPHAQSRHQHKQPIAWENMPGLVMLIGAVWCGIDYQYAVNIYAPSTHAGPLAERIATGRTKPWFGYQADYAWVTDASPGTPSLAPVAFRRTLHNLLDARLMIAYARSLAEHGQVDKARYVVQRLNEFHHPLGQAFMAPCQQSDTSTSAKPFQCTPPDKHYNWQQVLP
jgi:O-antigen ligase